MKILQIKLFCMIIISSFLIFIDNKFNTFLTLKNYSENIVNTLYLLNSSIFQILDNMLHFFTERKKLISENHALKKQLLIKNSDLLLMEMYKEENQKLYKLLASPLYNTKTQKMIAKIIAINANSQRDQIIINKGSNDKLYIGQPIINEQGVVGQIIAINQSTSRAILICDKTHALPIQILRNNIRLIAQGNGCHKNLQLKNLPKYIDIRIGDLLITSGLGGNFPEGYPVAKISSIILDKQNNSYIAYATPTIHLEYLHHLLLLWPN